MRRTLFLIAVMATAPAHGQTKMGEVLSGKVAPILLKLEELDGNWRRITAAGSGDGGFAQVLAATYGIPGAGTFYTRGQTITIDSETYLVAYRPATKPLDLELLGRGSERPKPEKLKADTQLWLSLLNLRTAGNITDIRLFSLEEEIAGSAGAKQQNVAQQSLNNLKQIGLALLMYSQDYDEVLPPMKNPAKVKQVLMPYVKNNSIFSVPESGEAYVPNAVLSGKKLAHIASPAQMVAFYEASPIDNTRGVVFLDGHAKRIPESEWRRLKWASKIR